MMNARSTQAWIAFRARVDQLGGRVIEPEWLGNMKRHRAICADGHECSPRPANVQQGEGLCGTCRDILKGRTRSTKAWERFRARVEKLGGRVVEEQWLGNHAPHRATCPEGHECSPIPATIQQGYGMCLVCVGQDSATAEASFRARVEWLGGRVVESAWLGANHPHRIVCVAGHEVAPRPASLQQGNGPCRICGEPWGRRFM